MKKTVVCTDMVKNQYEVPVEKLLFRPSAYGILILDNNILLSKLFDGYDFPGGGVNLGETLAEAVEREFLEETGINIKATTPVYCNSTFFRPFHPDLAEMSEKYKDQYWNCPMVYYLVEKVSGNLSKENFDEDEKTFLELAEWIDLKNIKDVKFNNSGHNFEIVEAAMRIRGLK